MGYVEGDDMNIDVKNLNGKIKRRDLKIDRLEQEVADMGEILLDAAISRDEEKKILVQAIESAIGVLEVIGNYGCSLLKNTDETAMVAAARLDSALKRVSDE